MITFQYKTFKGEEVTEIIPLLGQLRIQVFCEFPYLYEGDLEYEREYLNIYAKSPLSIVHCVFEGTNLIGATTGIPLQNETEEIQQPFKLANERINSIFYFGESIVLPAYRGFGLGHHFFDVREKHATDCGFTTTVFCAVIRNENHPLKPMDYRSNDAFWMKRGYAKTDLFCEMQWLDREETSESNKELQFWKRTWK